MAKKKRTKYVSKGERRSVKKELTKAVRRDRSSLEREIAKLDALAKGKVAYVLNDVSVLKDNEGNVVRKIYNREKKQGQVRRFKA